MKRLLEGLACLAVLVFSAAPLQAQIDYGIVLHVTEPSYNGCQEPLVDDAIMTCKVVTEDGDINRPTQFVWVFVYGYNNTPGWTTPTSIGAVEFGIEYDPTVIVTGWSACAGGPEVQQQDQLGNWPDSGTGNALTWTGGSYNSPSPEKFAKVGFFSVAGGSVGRMIITEDRRLGAPPEGILSFSDGNGAVFELPDDVKSSADLDGLPPDVGRRSCAEPVPVKQTSWTRIKALY